MKLEVYTLDKGVPRILWACAQVPKGLGMREKSECNTGTGTMEKTGASFLSAISFVSQALLLADSSIIQQMQYYCVQQ